MQKIEGAFLVDEHEEIIRTEFFSDLDLLGVIKSRDKNRYISTLHQRGDEIEVPTGGKRLRFWVEIYNLDAISGSLEDALSHLRASAMGINA